MHKTFVGNSFRVIGKGFSSGIGFLSEFALPSLCINCGKTSHWRENPALCESCHDISWKKPRCERCGHFCHEREKKKTRCSYCRHITYPFRGISSLGPYRGWLRTAIVRYKFYQDPLCCRYLQGLLSSNMMPKEECVISYIPSHSSRLRERGSRVQHMKKLLNPLAKKSGYELRDLFTKKDTPLAQVDLSGDERRRAVQGTLWFSASDVPETVYLYDDVWTTGSTMREACRVLKEVGVKRILGRTLAASAYEETQE